MTPPEFRPSTVVITGVTRGLGRALVDEFVRLGHTVFGCARTRDQIEELAGLYPKHDFQTVNVASDPEVKAWAESILTKYGAPDFVLNNAAVVNPKASLWQVENRDFSDEIDINIKGVANVIRHFAPSMIQRKSGIIVNFSSRWGKNYEKNMAPYCATKWAVEALTRILAEELKSEGVAAIGLNPGVVKTGMLERYLGSSNQLAPTNYVSSVDWAKIAAPLILSFRLKDTGKVRKIPTQSHLTLHSRVKIK